MTHPGVGPQTALGMVLTLGEVSRFASARQVASYLGLTPREHSSGGKQRLGHISKQGSSLMRFLLVEAGQTAVSGDEQLRRAYARLAAKKSRAVAKVMVARRLAVRLYWMLRRTGRMRSWHVMRVSPGHSVVSSRTPTACVGSPPPSMSGEFELVNHGRRQ